MSSCLIIYDENNYYIGADTACSVFYNERPYRYSDNMNKIFSCGDDTYFCSGNLYYVQKTVKWINDTFLNLGKIDASMLSDYLINNYHNQNCNKFDIEIVICRKTPEMSIIQLSQYNSFRPVIHGVQKNNIGIISCGYKTKQIFDTTLNMLSNRNPVIDVYHKVYDKIADNQVGGYLTLYFNGKQISKTKISENNIIYSKFGDNPALVISDALVGGYIEGTEILGGSLKIGQMPGTTGENPSDYALVVNEDGTVQINAWGGELADTITSIESTAYDAIVSASTTPIFDENIQTTVLICTIYQNNKVVTPSGTTYSWIRTSSDPTGDAAWNATHANLTENTLTLTGDDVEHSAQFACEVNIP